MVFVIGWSKKDGNLWKIDGNNVNLQSFRYEEKFNYTSIYTDRTYHPIGFILLYI